MIGSRRTLLTAFVGLAAATVTAPAFARDANIRCNSPTPRLRRRISSASAMVQFGAALNQRFAWQGGVGRFLDLRLLQLRQHAALRDKALQTNTRARGSSSSASILLNFRSNGRPATYRLH